MSEDHRHLERLEDEKELAVLGESHDAANEPVTHTPDQHMELQMDIGEIEHVADDEAQEEEDIIKEGAQNGPEVEFVAVHLLNHLFEDRVVQSEQRRCCM